MQKDKGMIFKDSTQSDVFMRERWEAWKQYKLMRSSMSIQWTFYVTNFFRLNEILVHFLWVWTVFGALKKSKNFRILILIEILIFL